MNARLSRFWAALLAALCLSASCFAQSPAEFKALFDETVTLRDPLSSHQVSRYRAAMAEALAARQAGVRLQFVVVVDRSPGAQHLLLFLGTGADAQFIGATPVSTGDDSAGHFITPAGVFEHSLTEDFRARGIENEIGVRGYGRTGLRVWDFGWQTAQMGHRPQGKTTQIRMQLHATDPTHLESHLGYRHSEGCIRVPASLNEFMDRYGVLDESYDQLNAKTHHRPWVWSTDHVQTPYSGRFLVVLDTPK